MTIKLLRAGAIALALALAACGADTPEAKLAKIESLQAKNLEMTEDQKSQVATLLAEGRAAMADGRSTDAGNAFDGALAVLKKAEDAALYNKAD